MEHKNPAWCEVLWSMSKEIADNENGIKIASEKDLHGMSACARVLFATFTNIALSAVRVLEDKKKKNETLCQRFDGELELLKALRLLGTTIELSREKS
jgi:hypothetical protein